MKYDDTDRPIKPMIMLELLQCQRISIGFSFPDDFAPLETLFEQRKQLAIEMSKHPIGGDLLVLFKQTNNQIARYIGLPCQGEL